MEGAETTCDGRLFQLSARTQEVPSCWSSGSWLVELEMLARVFSYQFSVCLFFQPSPDPEANTV